MYLSKKNKNKNKRTLVSKNTEVGNTPCASYGITSKPPSPKRQGSVGLGQGSAKFLCKGSTARQHIFFSSGGRYELSPTGQLCLCSMKAATDYI